MKTYEVRAKRWARGWELHIDGLGVTQSHTLRDAEAMARDYIELDTGAEPGSFAVTINVEAAGLENISDEMRAYLRDVPSSPGYDDSPMVVSAAQLADDEARIRQDATVQACREVWESVSGADEAARQVVRAGLDRLIEAAEDAADAAVVRAARADRESGAGPVPWDQVKAELGIA